MKRIGEGIYVSTNLPIVTFQRRVRFVEYFVILIGVGSLLILFDVALIFFLLCVFCIAFLLLFLNHTHVVDYDNKTYSNGYYIFKIKLWDYRLIDLDKSVAPNFLIAENKFRIGTDEVFYEFFLMNKEEKIRIFDFEYYSTIIKLKKIFADQNVKIDEA
jgi:hypothetical protein